MVDDPVLNYMINPGQLSQANRPSEAQLLVENRDQSE